MEDIGREFLNAVAGRFEQWKVTVEKAVAPLDEGQLHWRPDPESNSVAVLLRHISGNLISRWRQFLTTDGEKPDRNRDAEFEVGPETSREELMRRWEEGWALLRAELAKLTPDDLLKTTYVRSRPQIALDAILRQLAHLANHAGQIVYISKHVQGPAWRTLSIERGIMGRVVRSGESDG